MDEFIKVLMDHNIIMMRRVNGNYVLKLSAYPYVRTVYSVELSGSDPEELKHSLLIRGSELVNNHYIVLKSMLETQKSLEGRMCLTEASRATGEVVRAAGRAIHALGMRCVRSSEKRRVRPGKLRTIA